MVSTTHAFHTAATAAGARIRAHQELGFGWPTVTVVTNGALCDSSVYQASASNPMDLMAVTGIKRQPRRLGQRST